MEVEQADVLKWAAWYSGPKFHALIADPPYEMKFMGKDWDGKRVSFQPSTWAALAEHLLPGAFLFAFAGTRGYHRMATAMEDSGLIIHPAVGWLFATGFPKATRVKDRPAFEGHRYGLQALKPAFEFIACAQKPYEGRPVECITETGAGALWIEGGRVPMAQDDREWYEDKQRSFKSREGAQYSGLNTSKMQHAEQVIENSASGRWPANFILSEEAAERLDELSGVTKSHGERNGKQSPGLFPLGGTTNYDDESGASRFFYRYQEDALDEADPVYYCAKASRRERDAGLEDRPLKTIKHYGQTMNNGSGNLRNGDGSILPSRNPHPTIKPIALARYLATLLLPPSEYAPRRILVPFAGAGSEMVGAMQAGWEEVTGIEMEEEYATIARARLEYWANQKPAQIEMVMK